MNPRAGDSALNKILPFYNAVYEKLAQTRTCVFIDNYSRWTKLLENDRARYMSYIPDGCHPTEEGCKNIVTPNIAGILGVDNIE
jgi:acyl-CoA thioesterase I